MKNDTTNKIHARISVICKHLRTRHSAKKHGGYDIYEDDKIVASLDTYVANVRLSLKMNGELVTVFSANYLGDVYTYHRGVWEPYLEQLADKALEAKAEHEKAEAELREAKRQESYGDCSEEMNAVFNGEQQWRQIDDINVQIVYACTDDDCDCPKDEVSVNPSWHTHNGTPICDNGADMAYIRTEINA
jgi:hypothetical protein